MADVGRLTENLDCFHNLLTTFRHDFRVLSELSESESDFDLVLMPVPAELVVWGIVWVSSLNLMTGLSILVFLVTSG